MEEKLESGHKLYSNLKFHGWLGPIIRVASLGLTFPIQHIQYKL